VMNPRKKKWLDIVGYEPKTLDELGNGVCAVIQHNLGKRARLEGLKWDVSYSPGVSNYHNCPFDGVKNWGNEYPERPSAYPGFAGRVWARYSNDPGGFGDVLFQGTGTHTGTGGYGAYSGPWQEITSEYYRHSGRKAGPYCLSWDYKFFIQDWPLVGKNLEREFTMKRLKEERLTKVHTFEFYDTAAHKEDARFIAERQKELAKL
jgi:hypothetical protein